MDVDLKEKLKTVFDVCDVEKDGYITIAHFKNLAKEHFGADSDESIVGIIQILDPDGKGKISFSDFCQGVQQIVELQPPTPSPIIKDPLKDPFSFPSGFTNNNLGDLLGDLSPTEGKEASEASAYTFNEYDTNTDEDGGGLLIDLSTPEPVRRNLQQQILSHSQLDCTDEENFEDYGEADDLESDTSHSDSVNHNKSCETCHKIRSKRGVNYREKHHRRSSGVSRRLNSTFNSNYIPSRNRSPAPDEVLDDIDGNFNQLNDRIQFLEQQLLQLSEEKKGSDNIKTKFKDENNVLIQSIGDRVHTLEEQLKDVEVKSDERVIEEQKKYKDIMSRKEREKSEEMEYVTNRLHRLERENEELKLENPKLRAENERLRSEKTDLQERLTELQIEHSTLQEECEEVQRKSDRERETTGQLLDELGKELGELRQYKIDTEPLHRQRGDSQTELPGRYQSLQAEVSRLKEALTVEWRTLAKENKSLQDVNEDLNAQLLNQCLTQGRGLMNGDLQHSLAEELDHLTKEELMTKLREQTDISLRLKTYVDKILLLIMEKNPSLLEVYQQ